MFCQRPDADLLQKLKNRPLKHNTEACFRMRKKRNLLNGTFVTSVTVDPMQRIKQVNFPNQPHRQAAHISLTKDFQCNIL